MGDPARKSAAFVWRIWPAPRGADEEEGDPMMLGTGAVGELGRVPSVLVTVSIFRFGNSYIL